MAKYNKILLVGFISFIYIECKQALQNISQVQSVPDVNRFKSFYEIFHTDSLYQLNHINFPLEGLPEQSDTASYPQGFKWQRNDWQMHRPLNTQDSLFHREFQFLDSTMILEIIYHKPSSMKLERRYSYDTDWKLIYYSPLRMPVNIQIN